MHSNDLTAETTPTPPAETKEEVAPAEEPVKEEAKPVEQKSFFAKMCGCFGGSGAKATEPVKKDEPKEVEKVEDVKEQAVEKAEA